MINNIIPPVLRKPIPIIIVIGLISVTVIGLANSGFGTVSQTLVSCGISSPAFCETFDTTNSTVNRSGQLDGSLWGVSRLTGDQNIPSPSNGWPSAVLSLCGISQTIAPDNDVFICNGQLNEGQDDNGTVTTIAMYPKQPFDFSGRTGKVTFDVSNDSAGTHSAWPEFWITDKPTSAPFAHEASIQSLPQNGFGIRFAGFTGTCPEGSAYVGVDSAITVSNYVENDTFNGGNLVINGLDCVKKSTGPTQLNHYEIDVSQNTIDVFGTDAGTITPLKHLASIPNAGLTFSRGLVWIEDVHYNGSKFGSQGTHAFTWDNVGFDGPLLTRDLTYDVLDNTTLAGQTDQNNGLSVKNLGYFIQANQTETFTFNNVSTTTATAALLTYNFYYQAASGWPMTYSVNGHVHTLVSPNPHFLSFGPNSVIFPIVLTDVIPNTNTVSFTPSVSVGLMNIDLVMAGAGAGPIPTITPTLTAVPTPSSTPVATATSIPTVVPSPTITATPSVSTCTVVATLNGVDTRYTRPITYCTDQ